MTTPYSIYDPTTGRILRAGETSQDPLGKAEAGEAVHVGAALDGDEWKIVNGAPAAAAMDPLKVKSRAIAYLKRLRSAQRSSTIVTIQRQGGSLSITVDTAEGDVSSLNGLATGLSSGFITAPIEFKGGGVFYDLTAAELQSVLAQAFAAVQAAYSAERVVLADIEAGLISTEAEIDAAYQAALTA